MFDVAERLWDLQTVRMERQWNEPTGFEDQEDVLEAVLQILHGRRATVETDGKSRKRKGALDDADKAFLRGLMRRYGLELIDHPEKPCLWQEVFTKADFLQTLWFVIQRLLHPRASGELTALRCLHQPDRIAALRASRSRALRRNGVHADVLSLHQELLEWQMDTGTSRLPNESEDRPLSSKIDSYKEKDRRNRISSMKKAYPPDFEPLEQLSLDCLTGAGDSSTGVQWRSEFEEQLMLSVPGWTEDAKKSRTFHTLQEVLQCGDVFLQQCFATLQSYGLSLQRKLSVLAAKLQCTPSIPGVAEAMSTRLLSTPQDTEEMELNRYVCRLCDFQCADKEVLQEHIKDAHSNDTEVARAWVEYRKKVPSWTVQRSLMANADAALREPGRDGALREERACVVCARRFWSEELRPVILFQDPAAGAPETVDGEEEDQRVKKIAPSQQRRLCRVLGVQRYLERWPQLQARPEAIAELKASAVEHPFLKEELLLLHRRRTPADVRDPCDVCRECCGPLTSSMVSLPRYSLANDLWIGRQLPALRNLAAATKRLLPMVRTCLQVTVLQPGNLVREERQKGFIGNSIFLPQAAPTAIRAVLPPPEQDMQESILFVLVGDGQNKTALQSSALLKAPRGEYESAVRCLQSTSPYYEEVTLRDAGESTLQGCILETGVNSYLAKQLLQQGPADAQGQEDDDTEENQEAEPMEDAGHLVSSIVGLNDGEDEQCKWLKVGRDMQELCRRKPGSRLSVAQQVCRDRDGNVVSDGSSARSSQLLGREGLRERQALGQIKSIQSLAAQSAQSHRQVEADMFQVRPSKLVVFRYLLIREELQFMFGIVTNQWNLVKETLLPVMYDVQRRLELMKSTKAYVQRRGFAKHLNLIANVSTEDLLKAMALHGEAADIRTLMQDANVDPALKRALGGVLQSTANIIGLEGHRSQIRLRGHAAGWHYGNAHLFVTPNLADVRAPLMLQLHLQTNGIAEVEAQSICLDWDDEIPGLPTAATMRRIIARDPVSQARFFHLMMKIFFEELLGIEPTFQKERYAVGFPRCFEDGMATSLYGGIFGDIAALCGPLETQGRGSMHPHILIVLLGHDLISRAHTLMRRIGHGELVVELQRWSRKVLEAAAKIRWDSQLALSDCLNVEGTPLPFSEKQRSECGKQYAEGMSNPAAQVVMRCNVDVKYLGRAFDAADLEKVASEVGGLSALDPQALPDTDAEPQQSTSASSVDVPMHDVNLDSGDVDDSMQVVREQVKKRKTATVNALGPHKDTSQFSHTMERILIDMFRDMEDVQFYTGEYASKKFEVSRNLLPELYAGVQKLETEETERLQSASIAEDATAPQAASSANLPGGQQQHRALSILRRLAFGMQRCVAKSNGEMAYQLLYEQEQYVTFGGYNMFFRYIPYAIMQRRLQALTDASADHPECAVPPLDVPPPDAAAALPIQEVADIEEEVDGRGSKKQQLAHFNQKDDFLHRGSHPLLRSMSLLMYSRFVRRVDRSKAGQADGLQFFEFDAHYPHHRSSLQEVRLADNNVVVPTDLRLPADHETEKLAAYMLGLTFPFPTCTGDCNNSQHCFACHVVEVHESRREITARFTPVWRHWNASMKVRQEAAQTRILAGLSVPVLRDVVGVRAWYSAKATPGRRLFADFMKKLAQQHLGRVESVFVDIPRIHELICMYLNVEPQSHYSQLTPLEHLCTLQLSWLERYRLHQAARRLSSSQRRAERFAYMSNVDMEEADPEEDETGAVDIEGEDADDDMQHADALERMECAPHPIHKDSLADALFRDREWYAVMANSKAKALKTSLQKLMQFVNCLGGVPDVKHGMGIRSNGTTELDRTWSHADTGRIFAAQKQYLEYIAGG
ncbi:unnamed protein product [Durusdinium trenchii]|uniref:C2H2-type domain-containing protein n=1 Tax=Durusdinium trenchii TaxID=1381693 RepID=A0ABP0Q027_9DINO